MGFQAICPPACIRELSSWIPGPFIPPAELVSAGRGPRVEDYDGERKTRVLFTECTDCHKKNIEQEVNTQSQPMGLKRERHVIRTGKQSEEKAALSEGRETSLQPPATGEEREGPSVRRLSEGF